MAEALVAEPKLFGDLAGSEEWCVELCEALEGEVFGDAGDADGDGELEGNGEEVGAVEFAGLLLGAGDGLFRGESFVGEFDLGEQLAIGDAFAIEDEEGGAW